jgi:hypothetical protein
VSKGHLRSLMHKMFDLATLWEYLPLERRNPIKIVKIKDVTRRTKEAVVPSLDQSREVVRRLPAYVNVSDHDVVSRCARQRSPWTSVGGLRLAAYDSQRPP